MDEIFNTKERKIEFEKLFKNKIVPFFNAFGFERHTKASKRLFKAYKNGLSVIFLLEYKTFGSGFYDATIVYFDAEIGDFNDDNYLAMASIKTPHFLGNNIIELNVAVDEWLEKIKINVIPFMETHSTHQDILNSNQFYFAQSKEIEYKDFMKRKIQNIKE